MEFANTVFASDSFSYWIDIPFESQVSILYQNELTSWYVRIWVHCVVIHKILENFWLEIQPNCYTLFYITLILLIYIPSKKHFLRSDPFSAILVSLDVSGPVGTEKPGPA